MRRELRSTLLELYGRAPIVGSDCALLILEYADVVRIGRRSCAFSI